MSRLVPAVRILLLALVFSPVVVARQGNGPARDVPAAPAAISAPASLSGTVVTDDGTDEPLRRVRVQVSEQATRLSLVAVTDEAGRFTIGDLPPGRYSLSASKPGYVTLAYGAGSPRGQGIPLSIEAGQQLSDLVLRLPRGAVLTGRVTTPGGMPVQDANVQVGERRTIGGAISYQRTYTGPSGRTDDRGEYRVYGLPPGDYVVGVAPASMIARQTSSLTTDAEVAWATSPNRGAPPRANGVTYATVYYPGTTDPDQAAIVSLEAGQTRAGLDLVLQLVPTASISGRISRPGGGPTPGVQINAIRADAGRSFILDIGTMLPVRPVVAPDGSFTIEHLAAGAYALIARAPSGLPSRSTPPAPGPGGRGGPGRGGPPVLDLWAQAEVTLTGEDVTGVALSLEPGMNVSGRVVFDATTRTPPEDVTSISVRLSSPPGSGVSIGAAPTPLESDGSFEIEGLPPGTYLLGITGLGSAVQPTWVADSAMVDGINVLDTPMEIHPRQDVRDVVVTFTDRIAELRGSLVDGAGRPAPEYYVSLFPVDASQWRQGSRWLRPPVRPGTDGTFQIRGLPPGDYYLAATQELDRSEWYSADVLQELVPGALRLTLRAGETTVQDIRLAAP